MSRILFLRRVTPDQLADVRANPSSAASFLVHEKAISFGSGITVDDAFQFGVRIMDPAWRSELPAVNLAPITEATPPPGEAEEINLDKAWHGIHYLLTGTAEPVESPAGLLLSMKHPLQALIGETSPATFTPDEVRQFAGSLSQKRRSDLLGRYDPATMRHANVYPAELWRSNAEFDYLWAAFERLRDFIASCQQRGDALIKWIA